MTKKNRKFIPADAEDHLKWREWCTTTGWSSPKLFKRIVNSQDLELDKRIVEAKAAELEKLKRKFKK